MAKNLMMAAVAALILSACAAPRDTSRHTYHDGRPDVHRNYPGSYVPAPF